MLSLTRKLGQIVAVGHNLENSPALCLIEVAHIIHNKAVLRFYAPPNVQILREELLKDVEATIDQTAQPIDISSPKKLRGTVRELLPMLLDLEHANPEIIISVGA